VCLFVCLVAPVRIKGRLIANPRLSSDVKSGSSTPITLLGVFVQLPLFWSLTWCQRLLHSSGTEQRADSSNTISVSLPLVRHLLWNTSVNPNTKSCQKGEPLAVPFLFLILLQISLYFFNFCNFVLNIVDVKDQHVLPTLF